MTDMTISGHHILTAFSSVFIGLIFAACAARIILEITKIRAKRNHVKKGPRQ